LPIAFGILAASEQMPAHELHNYEFAGELSLSGELRPIRGALAMTFAMHHAGDASGKQRAFILPRAKVARHVHRCGDATQTETLFDPHIVDRSGSVCAGRI
jgi:predicted ATPase with chaperone activity